MPNPGDKFTITYEQLRDILNTCGSFYEDDCCGSEDYDSDIDNIIDMVYDVQLRSK
jgi:hypothetical protein